MGWFGDPYREWGLGASLSPWQPRAPISHAEEGTCRRPALSDPAKLSSKGLVPISPPRAVLENRPLFRPPRGVDWAVGAGHGLQTVRKQPPCPTPTPGAGTAISHSSSSSPPAQSQIPPRSFPWHSFPPASRQRQTRPLVLPRGAAHGRDPVLGCRVPLLLLSLFSRPSASGLTLLTLSFHRYHMEIFLKSGTTVKCAKSCLHSGNTPFHVDYFTRFREYSKSSENTGAVGTTFYITMGAWSITSFLHHTVLCSRAWMLEPGCLSSNPSPPTLFIISRASLEEFT